MEHEQTDYCLLEGSDVFSVMPTGIAYREVLESNITTGIKYSKLYLSFINFKQMIRYMFPKKITFCHG
jgi:hypothetical protein